MKNELYRHKKSDRIKWTLTAIAFALSAVLLVSACLQLFGKGKVKPSEWFKKADKPQAEQTQVSNAVSFNVRYPDGYQATNDTITVTAANADSKITAIADFANNGVCVAKLDSGLYTSITITSAHFRVSATEESKTFENVKVSGNTSLLNDGEAISFAVPKMNGLLESNYTDTGIKITNGNTKYYAFSDVTANDGFTVKYTMTAEKVGGANIWIIGGFFLRI